MSIPAHIKKLIFSFIIILAVFNFIKTTLRVIDRSRRLDDLKSEVSSLEKEKLDLQDELDYRKSEEFVVEEARNELGMVKPREELFVVSKVLGDRAYSDSVNHENRGISNAKMWLELFL